MYKIDYCTVLGYSNLRYISKMFMPPNSPNSS